MGAGIWKREFLVIKDMQNKCQNHGTTHVFLSSKGSLSHNNHICLFPCGVILLTRGPVNDVCRGSSFLKVVRERERKRSFICACMIVCILMAEFSCVSGGGVL